MSQIAIPVKGEIYKVKLRSGRTWLFKSAYYGGHLTEHQGSYCIDCNGCEWYRDLVSISRGRHVGDNSNIIELKPANVNEIAIFKRKLG